MYADYPDSGFRPTRPYRYMRLPGQELSPSGVPLVLGRINLGMAHDKKSGTMSLILRTVVQLTNYHSCREGCGTQESKRRPKDQGGGITGDSITE